MAARSRAPFAFFGLLAGLWLLNAIVAAWEPVIALDWSQLVWTARHASYAPFAWFRAFMAAHWKLGKLVGFVLVHAPIVHILVTPCVVVALLVGLFVAARRRLPSPHSWDDLLELALLYSLFWIAQPRAGLVAFYRPYVASELYGAALAVWFLAPYLCGWNVSRGWTVALVLAGLLAGTDTAQLATGLSIACAVIVIRTPRTERPRWMGVGLAAVFAGTVLCYALPPRVEFARVYRRGLEVNLDLIGMPIREGGELIALVAAFLLGVLVISKLRPELASFEPADADLPELARAPRYLAIWFALSAFAVFGPHYSEATLVPAVLVLCVAALPFLRVVMHARWVRLLVIALVAGIQLVVWTLALTTYHRVHGEYLDRMDRLARAPKGAIATIHAYSQVYPGFWFFGEDWSNAAQRELAARKVFGLRDIEFEHPFRPLERNPGIDVGLETTATDAQLRAAHPPVPWARSLWVAHVQFKDFLKRLRVVAPGSSARLVVQNLDFAQRAARPLLAGWSEGGKRFVYDARRTGPDTEDRYTVRLPWSVARRFHEAWLVLDGHAQPVAIDDGQIQLQPMTTGVWATVVCDPKVCLLVDAFIPRF